LERAVKRIFVSPWPYLFIGGIILILLPAIFLRLQQQDIRKWTAVHVRYEGQFETFSSVPYGMDYNSSRIVQFALKPGKGLLALTRLEDGNVSLKARLGAPAFDVQQLDRSEQQVGTQNVWTYVVMPKRAGDHVISFYVEFVLADQASPAQEQLFRLWANRIAEASGRKDRDLQSYVERTTVHVIEPWLRLETIVQVVGLLSAIGGVVIPFVKRDSSIAS
jgi:hypothetical protein